MKLVLSILLLLSLSNVFADAFAELDAGSAILNEKCRASGGQGKIIDDVVYCNVVDKNGKTVLVNPSKKSLDKELDDGVAILNEKCSASGGQGKIVDGVVFCNKVENEKKSKVVNLEDLVSKEDPYDRCPAAIKKENKCDEYNKRMGVCNSDQTKCSNRAFYSLTTSETMKSVCPANDKDVDTRIDNCIHFKKTFNTCMKKLDEKGIKDVNKIVKPCINAGTVSLEKANLLKNKYGPRFSDQAIQKLEECFSKEDKGITSCYESADSFMENNEEYKMVSNECHGIENGEKTASCAGYVWTREDSGSGIGDINRALGNLKGDSNIDSAGRKIGSSVNKD